MVHRVQYQRAILDDWQLQQEVGDSPVTAIVYCVVRCEKVESKNAVGWDEMEESQEAGNTTCFHPSIFSIIIVCLHPLA